MRFILKYSTMNGQLAVPYETSSHRERLSRRLPLWLVVLGGLIVAAVLVWQGVAAHGAPDPTAANTNRASAIFDIGILVFREGLECILVLSAITANMVGEKESHR
ncbi:MAG: hypothetical protein JO333_05395, partial [Verrucomicrobia bacterium]|nr:hypothetical protein [Verrucomicrobiota bacterium]